MEEVYEEPSVILIPGFNTIHEAKAYIQGHAQRIFEHELHDWKRDRSN